MATTSIEWTDETWNPIRGCSIVSKGCTNCYAMKQAHRFSGRGGPYEGLTTRTHGGPVWTGKVRLVPELLDAPLRWRKPRRVFVNSMSDLFHGDVPDEFVNKIFAVMALCPQHTFQVLTKRPERMRDYATRARYRSPMWREAAVGVAIPGVEYGSAAWFERQRALPSWPLPNVWLGVSVEDQATADERIPLLLETPAAVRFVSAEPLLWPVDLNRDYFNGRWFGDLLHWVIVGGESGPGARPCNVEWIRSIAEQCKAAAAAVFVKQLGVRPAGWCAARLLDPDQEYDDRYCDTAEAGEGPYCGSRCMFLNDRKGADPAEWPADLRVREMP